MKTVEYEKTITCKKYVTVDGKEFENRNEALQYEEDLRIKQREEANDKYEIISYDKCIYPIDESVCEDRSYTWFKVNDENELDEVSFAYNCEIHTPIEYPYIFCIEESWGDAYEYNYENSVNNAKEFFKVFGYEMILKPIESEVNENESN